MNIEKLKKGFEKMVLIRNAEETLANYYIENKIFSIVHFYVGQEAIASGVSDNLTLDDKMFGNHRSHGHYLAKGGDLRKMVAEMLGKKTGCCEGKGGSMHMIDKNVNFLGSTPILGPVTSIASGAALSEKLKKTKNIVVCFLGDGASEEGVVYESFNFASLFELPILIVIENNKYSINSVIKDRRSKTYNSQKIIEGIGLNYSSADGNDYIDVLEKSKECIDYIRKYNKPCVLECFVNRHMSHSSPLFDDKDKQSWYRDENDTYENRVLNCPISKLKQTLIENGVDELELNEIENNIKNTITETIKSCEQDENPNLSDLITNVYED